MSVRQRIEDAVRRDSLEQGPVAGTMGLGRTTMVWLAANMVVTTLLTGTLFFPGIPYGQAVLVIVLGTLVGGSVLVAVGAIGTRTGLPTMVLTRGAFGRRGGYLPAAFNLVVLMGWSCVQAVLAGVTVNHVVEAATGFSSPVLFSVLCQALVVALALFGHAGIARVEPWLAVVMVAVATSVLVTAFREVGLSGYTGLVVQDSGMTAPVAFDIVVATAISWTVLSADFNRHARSQRDGIIGTAVGYTASTTIAMVLGATALGYVVLRGGGLPESFDPTVLVDGFGIPLAVVVFLSVMATNTLVVYGMVMSYLNIRPRAGFLRVALVLGAVSIAGAAWQGLLEGFVTFLFLISALFVPVFAIVLADHYVLRRGRYSVDGLLADRGGAYWFRRGVNPAALGAFAVGASLAFFWTRVSPLPVGATIPSFAATAVVYLGLSALLRQGRDATPPTPAAAAPVPAARP